MWRLMHHNAVKKTQKTQMNKHTLIEKQKKFTIFPYDAIFHLWLQQKAQVQLILAKCVTFE